MVSLARTVADREGALPIREAKPMYRMLRVDVR